MKKTSRIDELLGYPNRKFSIYEQRARLLYLNKEFLQDLAKMEAYFSIMLQGWQILANILEKAKRVKEAISINELADIVCKKTLAKFGRSKWPDSTWFFKKWAIKDSWMGEQHRLKEMVQAGPLLCAVSPSPKETGPFPYLAIDTKLNEIYSTRELFKPSVYIMVDPWTTKTDIKRLCVCLPSIKKVCFGFQTESKRCFARDLCWYLLTTEVGLTPIQIARAWAEKRPDELRGLIRKTRDWKRAIDEDKEAVMRDYVVTGLPVTIGTALERMRVMIRALSLKGPLASDSHLDGEESIPNAEAILDIGELRLPLKELTRGSMREWKLVKKRGRFRVIKPNSK